MAILPWKEAAGPRVLVGPPGRVGDQPATQVLVELLVEPKEIQISTPSQENRHKEVQQPNLVNTYCVPEVRKVPQGHMKWVVRS